MRWNLNLLGKTVVIAVSLVSCGKEDIAPAPPTAKFKVEVGSYGFVSFINESTNGDSYQWDFGDGSGTGDQSPNHTFLSYESFPVQLTVTGPGGTTNVKQIVNVVNPLLGTWGRTFFSRTNCTSPSNNTTITCSTPCSPYVFTATTVNGQGPYSLSGNTLKFLASSNNPVITITIVGNTLTMKSQGEFGYDVCNFTSTYIKL